MTAIYIIGGICLFLFAVCMIRAEAVISFDGEFGLTVRAAGIPIRILPKKQKKIRLRDYTPRAVERRRKKEEKRAAKKERRAAKKEAKKAKGASGKKEKKKTDVLATVRLIAAAVKTAVSRFGKHLRVRVARLHLAVATGDAASTAILYGAVSQTVAYTAALLDSTSTLKNPAKSDVRIYADYLSEKTSADIEIGFSLRVWQLLDILFRSGFSIIRQMIRANAEKNN